VATLRFEQVDKVFDGDAAVKNISLEVEDGEFMVLVGPSGSGKSTLLRVMAGLETPNAGRVYIDDDDVTDAEPQERDLAMVFQAYALYPHKTVRGNLEFGLRMRGIDGAERGERVEAVAGTLGIDELLERKPGQLSGGQRQRVALGRALVREPRAFLLDEPLSNLDPALRLHARAGLARIHRHLAATFLYVTHDQEEAMTLGDRVAVLRDGRLEQVAPPTELYRRPATRFVGEFIGSPAMNTYRCRVEHDDGVRLVTRHFRLDPGTAAPDAIGEEVVLGIRPHDVRRTGTDDADLSGRVELLEPRGSDLLVRLRLGEGDADEREQADTIAVILGPDADVRPDAEIGLRLPREKLHFFDPEDGRRLEAQGERGKP